MKPALRIIACLLGVLSLVGCQSKSEEKAEVRNQRLEATRQVKVQGEAVASTGIDQGQFRGRLEKMLQGEQTLVAREFVLLHYDRAHDVLTQISPQSQPQLWAFILRINGLKCWSRVQKRSSGEQQKFYRVLADLRVAIEQADVERTEKIAVENLNAPSVLIAEMLRLKGVAAMLGENLEKAEEHFNKASQSAEDDLYLQSRCQLLLAECQRRQEKLELAQKNWGNAVTSLLTPMQLQQFTPAQWQSVIYWKQAGASWPAAVRPTLMRQLYFVRLASATTATQEAQTEALVWGLITEQQSRRKDWQDALTSAKKAEVLFQDQGARWRMELAGARALLALKKKQTATSILVDLGQNSRGAAQSGALAILGSLALKNDKYRRGHNLLSKAVQGDNWLYKSDAMADLGLSCFLIGQPEQGATWLREARQRFLREQRFEDILQSLKNEQAYYQHVGDNDGLKKIEGEILRFQNGEKS